MKFFVDQIISLMKRSPSIKWDIRIVRRKSYTIGYDFDYFLIDFNNFLADINRSVINNAQLISYKKYLQTATDSIIVSRFIGDDVYYTAGNSWEEVSGTLPKGISIYFPPLIPNPDNLVVKKFVSPESPLMKTINWWGFLNILYENPHQ
jgi:hypothetical protein